MRSNPKDIIFGILNDVYAPDYRGIDWWAAQHKESYLLGVNASLTTQILSQMVFALTQDPETDMGHYHQRTLFSEVRNIIWINHSGGSTADHVTKQIFEELGMEIPEDA